MIATLPFFNELSKNRKNGSTTFYNKKRRKFSSRIFVKNEYDIRFRQCVEILNRTFKLPLGLHLNNDFLIVSAHCLMFDKRSDAHNILPAILDILQEVTGINDRYFQIGQWTWEHETKKKKENLKEKNPLTLYQKGVIFLRVEKMSLEENLKWMMENNFMNTLTPREKIQLLPQILDLRKDGVNTHITIKKDGI